MQWIDRQNWKQVDWQCRMSDTALRGHATELNEKAQRFGEKQMWEQYNDCKNALFIVRSEQSRRKGYVAPRNSSSR